MPVTVYPDSVTATNIPVKEAIRSPQLLLTKVAPPSIKERCGEIFQTSFSRSTEGSPAAYRHAATDLSLADVIPSQFNNGFVGTALQAYSKHHRLVLRPDDVWIALLTQFSAFVNARAEDLRHLFVAHRGKKQLVVKADGTRYTVNFGHMAQQMTQELHKNVVDPELRAWIMPDFSTTRDVDRVVCAVAMMSTLQKYFAYVFQLTCGIPAVTLLGERHDWEALYTRIDRLRMYGTDAARWARLLEPIFQGFLDTFDDPKSDGVLGFWQRMIREYRGGSGPPEMSGWITAFCYFDKDGAIVGRDTPGWIARGTRPLILGEVSYPFVLMRDVAPSMVSVPVLLDDNGFLIDTFMIAGLAGASICGAEGFSQGDDTHAPEVHDGDDTQAAVASRCDPAQILDLGQLFDILIVNGLAGAIVHGEDARGNPDETPVPGFGHTGQLFDTQRQFDNYMVAGLARVVNYVNRPEAVVREGRDTLQPVAGWWLCEALPEKETAKAVKAEETIADMKNRLKGRLPIPFRD